MLNFYYLFSRKAEKVLFCNYCDFLWPQPGPVPRKGPACLNSCCHHHSHCPAPLTLTPGATHSQCLPVGDSSSPLQPSPGNEATLGYATSGSVGCVLPTAWPGVPVSPTPGEGTAQRYYLNFPTTAPPATEGQSPVLSCPSAIAERRAPMVTNAPGRLFRKASVSLAGCLHCPCPWTLGAQPRGWPWQQLLFPSPQPPLPPIEHQGSGPWMGNYGLGPTGLAWPPDSLALGWQSPPPPPRTTAGQPAKVGSTMRGGPSVQPHGLCPVSATAHGRHLAHRMPPVPVALPCVVLHPPHLGLGWHTLPSRLLTPGAFLCRFLNVILKSGK